MTTTTDLDDTQIRIFIIQSALESHRQNLRMGHVEEDSELLKELLKKIEEEEKNLQYYKDNHSEYFI
jgi:hypothetical protein